MFDDLIQEKQEEDSFENIVSEADKALREGVRKLKEYKKDGNTAIVCPRCGDMHLSHIGSTIMNVDSVDWDVNSFRCKMCSHIFLTKWRV